MVPIDVCGEYMNTNDQSFSELRDRLAEQGVHDVKFFFKLEAEAQRISETKKSVASVLTAYLTNQYQPMGKIGDADLAAS
jgi:hypothetical protein